MNSTTAKYYNKRYMTGIDSEARNAEESINRKCFQILKQLEFAKKLSGANYWDNGKTINVSLSNKQSVTIKLSSGLVGNPIDSNVSVVGWTLNTDGYIERNYMDSNLTTAKLFDCPVAGINISALAIILDDYTKR